MVTVPKADAQEREDMGPVLALPRPKGPRQRALDALSIAAQDDPERHAEAQRLARQAGVGTNVARNILDDGTPGQQARLRNDFAGILRGLNRTQRWLADPENARVAHDDVSNVAGIERALRNLRGERSWVGDMTSAASSGFRGLESSYYHLAVALGAMDPDTAAAGVARVQSGLAQARARRSLETQAFFQRVEEAEGFGVLTTALADPRGLSVLIAESLGFSTPAMVLGGVGSLAGPLGVAGGVGVGGVLVEFGAWVDQRLAEEGVDLTNPDEVRRAYGNAELMGRLQAEAVRKGIGTAAVDALSAFFGGRLLRAAGSGVARKAAAGAGELVLQSAAESAGEAAGQLAAVGEVDTDEAILEGVASLGQSGAEIALGTFARRGGVPVRRVVEAAQKRVQAVQDAETARAAAKTWKESKAARRVPERLSRLVEDVVSERPSVDREAWDAVAQEAGIAPQTLAERALGEREGRTAYVASAESGALEMPLAGLLRAAAELPDVEPLIRTTRWRPDGMTLAEAEAEAESGVALDRAVEEEMAGVTELFQEERTLRETVARLDRAIEALGEEGEAPQPSGSLEVPEGATPEALREAADAVAAGAEGAQEAVAGLFAPPAGEGVPSATEPTAPQVPEPAEEFARRDPAGLASVLRREADRRERAQQVETLKAERDAAQERLTALEAGEGAVVSADAQTLADSASEQLVAAGRSEKEARLLAQTYARAYEVLAERSGIALSDLIRRFPVSFVGPDGKAAAGLGVLRQGRKRGRVLFTPADEHGRRAFTVQFLRRANRSTFFHEFGHVWLQILSDIGSAEDAPQQIRGDLRVLRDWMGTRIGEPITEAQHEKFARGFERFIREGKAPSSRLRRAFAAFASWMRRLYADMRKLDVELTDSVRRVMDRMLATDSEILEAQADLGLPLPVEALREMSDEERSAYLRALHDAQDVAAARLNREARRDARLERLEEIRAQVAREVDAMPAVLAYHALRDGTLPDGTPLPEGVEASTIDPASVDSEAHRETLSEIGLLGAGGEDISSVADAYGALSVDQLVSGLAMAADKEAVVARLSRARLRSELAQEARGEAQRALANGDRSDVLMRELRHLRRLAAREGRRADTAEREAAATGAARSLEAGIRRQAFAPTETISDYRERARRALEGLTTRDIRPGAYLAAARRWSRRTADRVRVGAFQEAAEAKSRDLLNHELYRQALRLVDQARRDRNALRKMRSETRRKVLGKAGFTYQDQMDALLERVGLGTVSAPQRERLQGLLEWKAAQEKARAENGDDRPIHIPESLLREARTTNWRDLRPADLHDIREFAEHIYHLAKTKNTLLAGRKAREMDAVVSEMVETIVASKPERDDADQITPLTTRQRKLQSVATYMTAQRKLASLARVMDQDRDGGPVVRHFVRRLNDAQTSETGRLATGQKLLDDLLALHPDFGTAAFSRPERIPGFARALSHEGRLGLALHWGNADGRERLTGALGIPEQEIRAALATLTERDVEFLNEAYKWYDAFWPEIVALETRTNGIAPKKVEAIPYDTPGGRVTGGYHRIKYAGVHAHQADLLEQAKAVRSGAYGHAQTRHGHTKARAEHVDKAVRLDLGVMGEHLYEVVHDLTHREALMDLSRMLRDKRMETAILRHYGPVVHAEMRETLVDVAGGSMGAKDRHWKFFNTLRINAGSAILGFKALTGMVNITGLTQAWRRVGSRHMQRAFSRLFRSDESIRQTMEWVYSVSPFMEQRAGDVHQLIADARDRLKGVKRRAWREAGWAIIIRTQQVVDIPTWLGAYAKAIDAGVSEAEAIARADQTVRDTQGSAQVHDLSRVQRGGAVEKLFTMFLFFQNAQLNQGAEGLAAFRRRELSPTSLARLTTDMMLVYILPSFLVTALYLGLRGTEDDEDEASQYAIASIRRLIGDLLGQFVGVREMVALIDGFEYQGPAALRIVPETKRLVDQTLQGEADAAFRRALVNVVGFATGAPAAQVNATLDGLQSVKDGDVSGVRVLTAPIFGAPRKER